MKIEFGDGTVPQDDTPLEGLMTPKGSAIRPTLPEGEKRVQASITTTRKSLEMLTKAAQREGLQVTSLGRIFDRFVENIVDYQTLERLLHKRECSVSTLITKLKKPEKSIYIRPVGFRKTAREKMREKRHKERTPQPSKPNETPGIS